MANIKPMEKDSFALLEFDNIDTPEGSKKARGRVRSKGSAGSGMDQRIPKKKKLSTTATPTNAFLNSAVSSQQASHHEGNRYNRRGNGAMHSGRQHRNDAHGFSRDYRFSQAHGSFVPSNGRHQSQRDRNSGVQRRRQERSQKQTFRQHTNHLDPAVTDLQRHNVRHRKQGAASRKITPDMAAAHRFACPVQINDSDEDEDKHYPRAVSQLKRGNSAWYNDIRQKMLSDDMGVRIDESGDLTDSSVGPPMTDDVDQVLASANEPVHSTVGTVRPKRRRQASQIKIGASLTRKDTNVSPKQEKETKPLASGRAGSSMTNDGYNAYVLKPKTQPVRRSTRLKKSDPIDLCSDDEEKTSVMCVEPVAPRRSPSVPFELARIFCNDEAFTAGGKLAIKTNRIVLTFKLDDLKKVVDETLTMDDLKECKWYAADEEDDELMFVSIRTGLTDEYVLEFRDTEDFKRAFEQLKEFFPAYFSESSKLVKKDIERFASPLLELQRKEREARRSSPRKRTRSSSRKARTRIAVPLDEILVVYPFNGDLYEIEKCAHGLKEATTGADKLESYVKRLEEHPERKMKRPPKVTIVQEDRERLDGEIYLNDTIIDFWMQWLIRYDNKVDSKVHLFTSHFYSTLTRKGAEEVESWTARNNINIFEKEFILIPINKSLHWSLCVVVNPGQILHNSYESEDNDDEDIPACCMIFLDSLKAHQKMKVGVSIRKWLNHEWQRLGMASKACADVGLEPDVRGIEKPFTKRSMDIFSPKIPYQRNGYDCGVFVCRYAYAVLQRRGQDFQQTDLQNKLEETITNNEHFQFDEITDIERLRSDMGILIDNLQMVYQKWKKAEMKKEKLEREKKLAAGSSSKDVVLSSQESIVVVGPGEDVPKKKKKRNETESNEFGDYTVNSMKADQLLHNGEEANDVQSEGRPLHASEETGASDTMRLDRTRNLQSQEISLTTENGMNCSKLTPAERNSDDDGLQDGSLVSPNIMSNVSAESQGSSSCESPSRDTKEATLKVDSNTTLHESVCSPPALPQTAMVEEIEMVESHCEKGESTKSRSPENGLEYNRNQKTVSSLHLLANGVSQAYSLLKTITSHSRRNSLMDEKRHCVARSSSELHENLDEESTKISSSQEQMREKLPNQSAEQTMLRKGTESTNGKSCMAVDQNLGGAGALSTNRTQMELSATLGTSHLKSPLCSGQEPGENQPNQPKISTREGKGQKTRFVGNEQSGDAFVERLDRQVGLNGSIGTKSEILCDKPDEIMISDVASVPLRSFNRDEIRQLRKSGMKANSPRKIDAIEGQENPNEASKESSPLNSLQEAIKLVSGMTRANREEIVNCEIIGDGDTPVELQESKQATDFGREIDAANAMLENQLPADSEEGKRIQLPAKLTPTFMEL